MVFSNTRKRTSGTPMAEVTAQASEQLNTGAKDVG